MTKQKPKPKGSRKRAENQSVAKESKPNLFERLYNRKKFDILGKKAKGERKHGQSVHDAVEKVKIADDMLLLFQYAVCSAAPSLVAAHASCRSCISHMRRCFTVLYNDQTEVNEVWCVVYSERRHCWWSIGSYAKQMLSWTDGLGRKMKALLLRRKPLSGSKSSA